MKKKLIDPGIIPFNSNSNEFQERDDLIIICENKTYCNWSFEKTGIQTFEYFSLEVNQNNYSEEIIDSALNVYSDLLFQIVDDYRTLQIAERVRHTFAWRNNFDNIIRIEKLVFNSICFLLSNNIESLFFQATPHNLPTWVLGRVSEKLGLDVYMCQRSTLPWRFYLVKDINEQFIVPIKKVSGGNLLENKVFSEFVDKNLANYSSAIPSYEKERLKKRKGKYWSWNRELKNGMKDIRLLLSLPFKKRLYNTYSKLAKVPDLECKYIVLFLHYQPERTSLPEGGYYSQQWLMIRTIALGMPEGWTLIVKEHPSTFTGKYDVRYRSPHFYKDINELKNVCLANLDVDTFELIDKAKFIATITGTVGIQSLIRGTAVLTFGCASFREFEYSYQVSNVDDIKNITTKYSSLNKDEIKTSMLKYLRAVNEDSESGITSEIHDDVYGQKVRLVGNKKILMNYINNQY